MLKFKSATKKRVPTRENAHLLRTHGVRVRETVHHVGLTVHSQPMVPSKSARSTCSCTRDHRVCLLQGVPKLTILG